MRNVLAFLVGVLLALVVGVATAAESCTQIRIRYSSGGTDNVAPDSKIHEESNWKFSHAEACSSLATRMAGLNIGGINIGTTTLTPVMSSGAYRCEGSAPRPGLSDQVFSAGHFSGESRAAECPPDSCEAVAELAEPVVVMGATASSGELCGSDDGQGGAYSGGDHGKGCQVVKRGAGISSAGGHWYGQVSYTGVSCGASAAPVNTASTANCIATGGTSVCVSRSQAGRVTAAGEGVDARAVPPGGCTLMSNGGAMCEAGAADGPKDSSDVPLTPTATLTATAEPSSGSEGTTTTINYYNDTTVSSSYTIVTGVGSTAGDTGDGDSPSLDDLEGGDMEAVDGFGESAGGFWDRVEASPLVSAVSGLSGALTGGACPAWNETVEAGAFGTYELDFSFICGMWEDIAPVISAVMLAVFALAALRILMSA